ITIKTRRATDYELLPQKREHGLVDRAGDGLRAPGELERHVVGRRERGEVEDELSAASGIERLRDRAHRAAAALDRDVRDRILRACARRDAARTPRALRVGVARRRRLLLAANRLPHFVRHL